MPFSWRIGGVSICLLAFAFVTFSLPVFIALVSFVPEVQTIVWVILCAGDLDGEIGAGTFFLEKRIDGFQEEGFYPRGGLR